MTDTSVHISEELNKHVKTLEAQIEHINTRQLEITSLITTIKMATDNIEGSLLTEKDTKQKGKFYQIISRNTSLMAELYTAYQSFENIKFKYFQDIGRNKVNKHRIVEIELRKVNEELNQLKSGELGELLMSLKDILRNSDSIVSTVELEKDSVYHMN